MHTHDAPRCFIAYAAEHERLAEDLFRSLLRRKVRLWAFEALEVLDADAFRELCAPLVLGDVLVLVLDVAFVARPGVLDVLRTVRWLARRSSFALEVVVIGARSPRRAARGLHGVPRSRDRAAAMREIARKIVAALRARPPRPRGRPTADELAVMDVIVRTEASVRTAYDWLSLQDATRLPRARIEHALRSAGARGWLAITELTPFRAGEPPDLLAELTAEGWRVRVEAVVPASQQFGTTLQAHRWERDQRALMRAYQLEWARREAMKGE